MVETSHLKEARKKLTIVNKALKKNLLSEDRCVLIIHTNGTIQLFKNAIYIYEYISSHGYLFLLTKNQGNAIYPANELIYFSKFKWQPVDLINPFEFHEDLDILKE